MAFKYFLLSGAIWRCMFVAHPNCCSLLSSRCGVVYLLTQLVFVIINNNLLHLYTIFPKEPEVVLPSPFHPLNIPARKVQLRVQRLAPLAVWGFEPWLPPGPQF